MIDISHIYSKVVGQNRAKRQLIHELLKHQETGFFSNKILTAGKGQGKSKIAEATVRGLFEYDENGKLLLNDKGKPKKRGVVEINCCSLKNLSHFVNNYLIPTQGKSISFIFDEASEIPRDISFALLTILNPNKERKTSFTFQDYRCDFDFKKQVFIFATAESNKINEMLLDRLERIDLEDYTEDELAEIVRLGLGDVIIKDNVLKEVSTVLRGNARSAEKIASKILSFLGNKKEFGTQEWKEIKNVFGINKLGLTNTELSILGHLAKNPRGTSLTALSALTGQFPETLRTVYEKFLLKHDLIEIKPATGRVLTSYGSNFLKELENHTKLKFQVTSLSA